MVLYYLILVVILYVLVSILYINRQFDQGVKDMVKEFKEVFPGKCMICSYHRYGRENGLTYEESPKPHYCIDKEKK